MGLCSTCRQEQWSYQRVLVSQIRVSWKSRHEKANAAQQISKERFHQAEQPALQCFCIFWPVEQGVSSDSATHRLLAQVRESHGCYCCMNKFTSARRTQTSAIYGHRPFVQFSSQTISRLGMICKYYSATIFTVYVNLGIPREFLRSPKLLLLIPEEKIVWENKKKTHRFCQVYKKSFKIYGNKVLNISVKKDCIHNQVLWENKCTKWKICQKYLSALIYYQSRHFNNGYYNILPVSPNEDWFLSLIEYLCWKVLSPDCFKYASIALCSKAVCAD